MAVDLIVAWNLPIMEQLVDGAYWRDGFKEVARGAMTLLIRGTYFNVSKRVKATFVN